MPLLAALLWNAALACPAGPAKGYHDPTAAACFAGLPDGPFVARVYYDDPADLRQLVDYDVWEFNDRRERYVLVAVDAAELEQIEQLGFRVEIDGARTEAIRRPPAIGPTRAGIPGFSCYRTVEETFAAAAQLAADHPQLASWLDVGDSWQKRQGLGGYDMRVLRLTNAAIPGPKPKLIATAAIHAREYTTAELATRFAEWLVGNYGTDADATWLLDYHEVHLMLQTNPDGRKQAEGGQLWRKNTNQAYCGATSSSRGADLNRNFSFQWNCCGGSSGSSCSETYHGASAASEPEVQAVQAYLVAEFPDQRGAPLGSPAPLDATGVYLDLHSYSELVLWPWGFGGLSGNDAQFKTLGRKLAYFNGYLPEQAIDLYVTDGTTDDYAYGELGVAALTFEIGTDFFQDCGTFESAILPTNLQALIYAAKVARTPYRTPAGPDALEVHAVPALVDPGGAASLTATIDDTRFNQTNGAEPTQTVQVAEYTVDLPPWDAGAIHVAMTAAEGAFDEGSETASAAIDTAALAPGKHTLFVRGRDVAGNWGAVSAAFFWIADGTEGTVSGSVTETGSGQPLAASVAVPALGTSVTTTAATGAYNLRLPAGSWSLSATAEGHLPRAAAVTLAPAGAALQDFVLDAVPPILLVDDDDNGPDVRASYTAALTALGRSWYDWNTVNSDHEPDAATLAPFKVVIWFTGDEFGGAAGPGVAGEQALATWLDSGKCLLISGQDYYYDRGLTSFIQNRLGVASATSDVAQTSATGSGVFAGLGPYSFSFPYTNYTDALQPAPSAQVAFTGSAGSEAVSKDTGWYRSSFWSFGLEALPTPLARQDTLGRFLQWCDALAQADADGDAVANAADCAPQNAGVWTPPSPCRDFTVTAALGPDNLVWSPPAAPGGSSVSYDVLRADLPGGFAAASCLAAAGSATTASDDSIPPAGGVYYYLVRTSNACGSTLGAASSGTARTAVGCGGR
ncbi:MAG TPA: M14 family zinc carboxypeptidase [Candidatus Polarisedimenticolaceae bacterium]|nr:M14 family zinc carboxypeptidase [Candidatus Polarisedimenticolaceae bacterium]